MSRRKGRGRGWFEDRHRHRLAGMGIKMTDSEMKGMRRHHKEKVRTSLIFPCSHINAREPEVWASVKRELNTILDNPRNMKIIERDTAQGKASEFRSSSGHVFIIEIKDGVTRAGILCKED